MKIILFWRQNDILFFNQQYKINLDLSKENFALRAEVSDLTNGTDAIEERVRHELGMVKSDEFFFQVPNK